MQRLQIPLKQWIFNARKFYSDQRIILYFISYPLSTHAKGVLKQFRPSNISNFLAEKLWTNPKFIVISLSETDLDLKKKTVGEISLENILSYFASLFSNQNYGIIKKMTKRGHGSRKWRKGDKKQEKEGIE